MSSATQVDMNWTGLDGGQGGAAPPPASVPDATGFSAGKYLSDEEILGIESPAPLAPIRPDVIPSEARNRSSSDGEAADQTRRDSSGKGGPQNDNEKLGAAGQARGSALPDAMPAWMQTLAADPAHGAEAQQIWQEHQACQEYRAAFSSPQEARAIKELFPGGAQEAEALRQATQSVDRIDAALFSGDPRAQSEVVAEIARANPAAFRSMFAEAAKVLAQLGQAQPVAEKNVTLRDSSGQALRQTREEWGTGSSEAGSRRLEAGNPGTNGQGELQSTSHESRITSHDFDPAAYASFERSTNETVARDVRSTISDTLSRVLPEGVAEGAARRIGDDIFNEIHRALAADAALSQQVGQALRATVAAGQGWRFGTAEQQRVASLLAGRAKQLVPSVARRVIGEWTSSVLGTARTKAARQAAAESRVDIAAPGGSLDSMPLRAMSRREVDYASMSDDEILAM